MVFKVCTSSEVCFVLFGCVLFSRCVVLFSFVSFCLCSVLLLFGVGLFWFRFVMCLCCVWLSWVAFLCFGSVCFVLCWLMSVCF